jgi:hypothetical protein
VTLSVTLVTNWNTVVCLGNGSVNTSPTQQATEELGCQGFNTRSINLTVEEISTATNRKKHSNGRTVGGGDKHKRILAPEFPDMDVAQFKACVTCAAALDRDQVPGLSSSNGSTYPPYPTHSPPLDCIN